MVNTKERRKQVLPRKLRTVALFASCVLSSSWVGLRADDSRIYVPEIPPAQAPNVLFSIDTSGSMADPPAGSDAGARSRMEEVKTALTGLIEKKSNLKAGLGRYHYALGGPIIFPVVSLDDPHDFAEEAVSISSVDRSSDDAEEVDGHVTLLSNALEMTQISGGARGSMKTVELTPRASSDDDEAGSGDGSALDSADLDLGVTDAGIRFPGDAGNGVPKNAIILHAEIEFVATGGASGDNTDVHIQGHDVDDSPAFDADDGGNTVSSRFSSLTRARVPWQNLVDVDAGDRFTTPDVRSVVQEIVSRDGWDESHAMTILFDSERGMHAVASFDHGQSGAGPEYAAPILRITYLDNGTALERQVDGSSRDAGEESDGDLSDTFNGLYLLRDEENFDVDMSHSGVIFRDLPIPDEAEVVWADIRFTTRYELRSQASDMEISGVTDPGLNGFSGDNGISSQPLTGTKVTWSAGLAEGDEEIFRPERGDPLQTPNLAGLIEEIRSTTAFTSGSNLGFVIEGLDASGDSSERHVCSFDGVQNRNRCPEGTSMPPTLRVVYAFPDATAAKQQDVGLRFNDVRVPQGAIIESAHLQLTVDSQTTEPGEVRIEIENNTEPGSFCNEPDGNCEKVSSGRPWGASAAWTTDVWDVVGEWKQSPDIASLVSSVTDRGDWCGGGSLAFRIQGADARLFAESYDKGGSGAPTLRIKYNTDNLGQNEGCITKSATAVIDDSDNDVEERNTDEGRGRESGSIIFGSSGLDIDPAHLVGLRFENVRVPKDATIIGTNLYLTSDDWTVDPGDARIEIRAQQHHDAPPFSDAGYDVSSRVEGAPSIVWSTERWEHRGTYSPQQNGVDLTPLIDEIVEGDDWESGNALVFTLQGTSPDHDRDAAACCGRLPRARLEIIYETSAGGDAGSATGREAILGIIDDVIPSGWTPTVDALFEAGAYFSSEDVHFGRTRGAGRSYEASGATADTDLDAKLDGWSDHRLLQEGELSRLSHAATYEPSSPVFSDDRCAGKPSHTACRPEHISNGAAPVYVSPFGNAGECEKGYLVVLSDGEANHNSSPELIKGLINADDGGVSSCSLGIPLIGNSGEADLDNEGNFTMRPPGEAEQCGLELAKHLYDTDFIDGEDGDNNVRTFTVGFDLNPESGASQKRAVEFLKALAFVGNGGDLADPGGAEGVTYGDGFQLVNNAEDLEFALGDILREIVDEAASLAAPGVSVNAVNHLYHEDDIYYGLFHPSKKISWLGNLKRFKVCGGDQEGCEFQEAIDKNGTPAVHTEDPESTEYGTLKDEAVGVWSSGGDSGPEVLEGGAGEKIPPYTERNVYVNVGSGEPDAPDYSGNAWQAGTSLHRVDLGSDTDGTGPEDDPGELEALKAALDAQGNCPEGNFTDKNECLNVLIEWMTGRGFEGDLPRYGDEPDGENWDRWAFADPMHSQPLILTYGIDRGGGSDPDDDTALSKIFVGTNDGGLRMINEGDGVEEWIFFPNSMLEMQSELKENAAGAHQYGIDGTPTVRIEDDDGDFVVEPGDGDFVHLYFGLRRGGRQVFALNVTPKEEVDGVVDGEGRIIGEKGLVEPRLLWRIDSTSSDFERLAQSWSTPIPARIAGSDGPKTVLIFGGGYNPGGEGTPEDGVDGDGTAPDGGAAYMSPDGAERGNAVFIVDADTGERLWWASSSKDGNGQAADANVPAMNTSIAAPVTLVDSNEDGHADRLYAVDLRGQVFRVDIAVGADDDFTASTVKVLAALGPDEEDIPDGEQAPNEDRRKFFYAPEVSRVNDTVLVKKPYDLINIVSGNRAHPHGTTTQDRAYGIRDFLIEKPQGGLDDSNFPACAPDTACTPGTPLDHDSLTDVTGKDAFVIRDIKGDGSIELLSSEGKAASEAAGSAVDELRSSYGWYFDLEGENAELDAEPDDPTTGEKAFAGATVFAGKMLFTTYMPPESARAGDACSAGAALGRSRNYTVDAFTGAPALNGEGGSDKIDRYEKGGDGPSGRPKVHITPDGVGVQVPSRQGSTPRDPGFVPTFNKTFWLEEQ